MKRVKTKKPLPVQTAITLLEVKLEAIRGSLKDHYQRIVYALPDGSLRIRLAGQDKAGDQVSLWHVRSDGKLTELGKG
jgi:hypothetical protein